MEEVSVKIDAISFDKTATTVVVDIESLQQLTDRSSGSPKMIRALSRKWSYRPERLLTCADQEEDIDHESSKKTLVKVNSQPEPLKQSLLTNKAVTPTSACNHSGGYSSSNALLDGGDQLLGRNKKYFNRIMAINPRKILCIFATVSSVGSLALIYFTLSINGTF